MYANPVLSGAPLMLLQDQELILFQVQYITISGMQISRVTKLARLFLLIQRLSSRNMAEELVGQLSKTNVSSLSKIGLTMHRNKDIQDLVPVQAHLSDVQQVVLGVLLRNAIGVASICLRPVAER